MRPKRTITPPEIRFWAKVDKTGSCWLWTGAIDPITGYGKFGSGKSRSAQRGVSAHRFSWELAHGPVPDGLCVLHRCDARYPAGDITYRRCVNPEHLWLGTNADNTRDMHAKGRGASGDRHPARINPSYLPRGDAHRARWDGNYLPRGEAHPNAKLTAIAVLAIRRRYSEGGISQQALAREYGVSLAIVNRIVRRTAWKHV